jgi:two-component system, chemotaxis family, protein-glutamate methylesterase/glutaminase
MGKIRVLIVNESATMRRLLSAALAADSAIEVVGTAANGRIALAKLPQTNPDVVTLELEAPALDALATLAELRKTHPHLPVILLSSQPQDGALASVNARWIGPAECVIGPGNFESEPVSIEAISNPLIAKIKTLCPREDQLHPTAKAKGSGNCRPSSRCRSSSSSTCRRCSLDTWQSASTRFRS